MKKFTVIVAMLLVSTGALAGDNGGGGGGGGQEGNHSASTSKDFTQGSAEKNCKSSCEKGLSKDGLRAEKREGGGAGGEGN